MPASRRRDAYRFFEHIALLIAGFAAIAFTVSLLPSRANAFWNFFSHSVSAETSALIPSSSTPALFAPVNSNPSAQTPIALPTSNDSALIAYSGPEGAAANVPGIGGSDRISVYVVRRGDTLSDIASMYGVSVNTILWANSLKSARDVHPGDTLIILPVSGIQRIVQRGDTLASLAKKYGADADEIATYNGLDVAAPLALGSTIIIPGGEIAAPTAPRPQNAPRAPFAPAGLPLLTGFFSNPLPTGRITQGIHGWNAVDIGSPRGTPIYAAASGVVIIVRGSGWNAGYGKYIVISHDNGVQTLYSHNSTNLVGVGQSVAQGQLIGYVGTTGLTTGPHLHFEVRGAKNPFAN